MAVSSESFRRIQELLYRSSGNVLEDGKEYLVELRMGPVIKELNMKSVDALLDRVEGQPYHPLNDTIVDAMMINETTFFRDRLPFDVLRDDILPELIEKRSSARSINIWSAACSSGQEPYSLSMLILEEFPRLNTWDINIIATDVSKTMIERASRGHFSQIEINRGLPVGYMVKYFNREGLTWKLKEEVKENVRFEQINLAGSWPLFPRFDIVFMRYVMIYFDVERKKDVLSRVRRNMMPDGYLFLGGTETTMNLDSNFGRVSRCKTAFYQIKN